MKYFNLCDKYKPKVLVDFLEYRSTVEMIIELFQKRNKSIVVLSGPCGCGKTTIVDYIVEQCKFKELYIDSYFVKSNKQFSETILNTQYTFYVKTCVVFSDFEFIMNDGVYNNTIKSCLSKIPHNIIFTINDDYLAKFRQVFGDFELQLFELEQLSATSVKKMLNYIIKAEDINLSKTQLNKCIKYLPDLRKVIQNLTYDNDKDFQFSHSSQIVSHIVNSGSLDDIAGLDMFQILPIIYECYTKHMKKGCDCSFLRVIVHCDIIHTNYYKTRSWISSECAILMLFLCIFTNFSRRKKYKPSDFSFGKILSKMSNKQTKYQTFSKLCTKYNCDTYEQLYLHKMTSDSTCKLLDNQFL